MNLATNFRRIARSLRSSVLIALEQISEQFGVERA